MQLFSVEQQKSQPLEAHAAAFSTVKVWRGQAPCSSKLRMQQLIQSGCSSVVSRSCSRFEVLTFCAVLDKGRRRAGNQHSKAAVQQQCHSRVAIFVRTRHTWLCGVWCELRVPGASIGWKR